MRCKVYYEAYFACSVVGGLRFPVQLKSEVFSNKPLFPASQSPYVGGLWSSPCQAAQLDEQHAYSHINHHQRYKNTEICLNAILFHYSCNSRFYHAQCCIQSETHEKILCVCAGPEECYFWSWVGPDHRFEGEGRENLEEMGVEDSSYI